MNFNAAREYLGIGQSTLREYVRTGKLNAYRMGGEGGRLLFFWKSDLDALFELVEPSQAAQMLNGPEDKTNQENKENKVKASAKPGNFFSEGN